MKDTKNNDESEIYRLRELQQNKSRWFSQEEFNRLNYLLNNKKELCDSCGEKDGLPLHDCPLASEVYDSYAECNCCSDCQSNCSDRI